VRSAHAHTFIIIISIAVFGQRVCRGSDVAQHKSEEAGQSGHHSYLSDPPAAPWKAHKPPVTVCSHLHMSPNVCVAVLTMRCCRHVATSFANWSRYKSPRESEVTTSKAQSKTKPKPQVLGPSSQSQEEDEDVEEALPALAIS